MHLIFTVLLFSYSAVRPQVCNKLSVTRSIAIPYFVLIFSFSPLLTCTLMALKIPTKIVDGIPKVLVKWPAEMKMANRTVCVVYVIPCVNDGPI